MGVRRYVRLTAGIAAVAVLGVGAAATAHGNKRGFSERLSGFQEVPALSSSGFGTFRASVDRRAGEIDYRLSFDNTETAVTQSHIHFENATNNGPIVVFLCSNLGNGPAGTQACPADGGTIRGTIRAADVGGGAAGVGLEAGNFDEFVRALRSGATYVNVHSVGRPGGEIRAQLDD
jgi:CHRD domain